jgi:hypothetical protein
MISVRPARKTALQLGRWTSLKSELSLVDSLARFDHLRVARCQLLEASDICGRYYREKGAAFSKACAIDDVTELAHSVGLGLRLPLGPCQTAHHHN